MGLGGEQKSVEADFSSPTILYTRAFGEGVKRSLEIARSIECPSGLTADPGSTTGASVE